MREVTVQTYLKRLDRLSRIANLDNTEQCVNIICSYQSTESYKELLSNSYDYWVKFKGLSWVKPKFTREDKPIFIPFEEELDLLISRATLKMSVYLELLKETAVDSGEAWKLRWIDFNTESKTVSITPTKNHNSRTLPISNHLVSRLMRLKRTAEFIFAGNGLDLDDFRTCFIKMRNDLAIKMENPRLHEIALKTFRHWKATMEYQRTKDILHVKWLLGHKRIENTMIYVHLIPFAKEEFVCKVAKNVEEAATLIESGFEYVCEIDALKLFRKRK